MTRLGRASIPIAPCPTDRRASARICDTSVRLSPAEREIENNTNRRAIKNAIDNLLLSAIKSQLPMSLTRQVCSRLSIYASFNNEELVAYRRVHQKAREFFYHNLAFQEVNRRHGRVCEESLIHGRQVGSFPGTTCEVLSRDKRSVNVFLSLVTSLEDCIFPQAVFLRNLPSST